MKGFIYQNPVILDQCEVPSFRFLPFINNKEDFLISVSGGIGDRVCAEPTIRFLTKKFPNKKIKVLSLNPELFSHLPVHTLSHLDNYDFTKQPVLVSFWHSDALSHKFLENLKIHAVDYMSLNLIQSTLPKPDDKVIYNAFNIQDHPKLHSLLQKPLILVHPGITWPSKTLPRQWYIDIVKKLSQNYQVAIVGQNNSSNNQTGVMDLGKLDAINLVNELNIEEFGALAKEAYAVITNDSFPLHIASASGGRAKIAYVSFIKNEAYLNHWRVNLNNQVEFGWRMKNFAKKDFSDILYDPVGRLSTFVPDMITEQDKLNAMPSIDEVCDWINKKD